MTFLHPDEYLIDRTDSTEMIHDGGHDVTTGLLEEEFDRVVSLTDELWIEEGLEHPLFETVLA